jgi:hypothetical protein
MGSGTLGGWHFPLITAPTTTSRPARPGWPGRPDARDPRGLRSDAPLLDAWLRFTAQAQAGELTPMSVPGHKQRHDLTGAVVAGDAPQYGGLGPIKHVDALMAEAEERAAAAVGRGLVQVLGGRVDPRQPGAGAGGGLARPGGGRHQMPAPVAAARAGPGRAAARLGAARA